MLGWLVGFPLLGIATLRAERLPAWVGWLLIAFVPVIVVLGLALLAYVASGIVVGVLWALIADGLRSLRRERSYLAASG